MTTPLPTPPNSATRAATFNADTDAFLGALPLFQTELNALQAAMSPIGRNMLINGGFDINQRAAASNSDDTFAFDRWNILTQTGAIAASQLGPAIESGYNNAMRLTQSQATPQRFGFLQMIENANCVHARGGSGTLSGRVRCSAGTTIRYAILGWTGTADAITSDVVNNWASATFTPGNFFLASNLSVLASGSIAVTANAWTNLTALTATLGTSFNNIIIFVWTDSTQAQNVTLDCDYLQFEVGASSTPFEKRSIGQELLLCQRYFAAYVGNGASDVMLTGGLCNSTTTAVYRFNSPQAMRAAPTISISGTYGVFNGGGNPAGTAITNSGDATSVTFAFTITVASGLTAATPAGFYLDSGSRLSLSAEL